MINKWGPLIIGILALAIMILMGIIQGKIAKESAMREAFIAEQELYLASVWSEKECYKKQLGVFITPKGCVK